MALTKRDAATGRFVYRPGAKAGGKEARPGTWIVFSKLGVRVEGDMAGAVRKGFDVETVDRLRVWLGESQDKVLKLTRISSPTLTRRKRAAKKLLTTEESDNVYRVAAVLQEAVQLFEGDEGAARNWLKQPAKALGGSTPLEHLDTTAGADEVRDLIHRLEYGVIT